MMQMSQVRWASFVHNRYVILWLALNIVDSLLTYAVIALGGEEVWLIYRLSGSMTVTTLVKYAVAVLVILTLAKLGRLNWLLWFSIPLFFPVAGHIKGIILDSGLF